jgi:hypothetical protein
MKLSCFLKKIFILLLLSNHLSAQKVTIYNGLDGNTKYSNTNTKNNKKSNNSKKKEALIAPNSISTSCGHFFNGIATIGYERMFSNRISTKASIGYCLFKGLERNTPEKIGKTNTYSNIKNADFAQLANYYFDIAGRFYISEELEDIFSASRFYAEIQFRNYRQSYNYQFSNSPNINPTSVITTNAALLQVGFKSIKGYITQQEFYVGIGPAKLNYNENELDANNQFTGNTYKVHHNFVYYTIGLTYGLNF